jgi:hypothetical protein
MGEEAGDLLSGGRWSADACGTPMGGGRTHRLSGSGLRSARSARHGGNETNGEKGCGKGGGGEATLKVLAFAPSYLDAFCAPAVPRQLLVLPTAPIGAMLTMWTTLNVGWMMSAMPTSTLIKVRCLGALCAPVHGLQPHAEVVLRTGAVSL